MELVEFSEEAGMLISNRRLPVDEAVNFTFHGPQSSVIDYVLCNINFIETVLNFEVLDLITKSDLCR